MMTTNAGQGTDFQAGRALIAQRHFNCYIQHVGRTGVTRSTLSPRGPARFAYWCLSFNSKDRSVTTDHSGVAREALEDPE
jgi:hypothetical protein